jgi:ParB family transcriptional regulator, chromosome partitioning protein
VARPKPGIGRGLEAILSVSTEGPARAREDELRELPVELISPSSSQPRRRFDEEALQALAGSVGERGVLQPVLVRPQPGGTYELVAGERRWRAAKIAGLETIPALVRGREDAEALELALIENMAREDLNPVEEARACAALVEELGLTRKQIGRRVGRSRVAVSNLMRLLDLPDEVLGLLESGSLSEGHGRALLLADDHSVRGRLGRSAAQEGWSVRVVEDRARSANAAGSGDGGYGSGRAGGRGKRGDGAARARRPPGSAGSGAGAAPAGEFHPDQLQAASEIAEALGRALGAEVLVVPDRDLGYRAELTFATADEAIDLVRRLGAGLGA